MSIQLPNRPRILLGKNAILELNTLGITKRQIMIPILYITRKEITQYYIIVSISSISCGNKQQSPRPHPINITNIDFEAFIEIDHIEGLLDGQIIPDEEVLLLQKKRNLNKDVDIVAELILKSSDETKLYYLIGRNQKLILKRGDNPNHSLAC